MGHVFIFGSSLSLDWAQAQLKSTWLSRPIQVPCGPTYLFHLERCQLRCHLSYLRGATSTATWASKKGNKVASSCFPHALDNIPLFPPPHHALFHQKRALKILEETKPQSKPPSKPSSQSVHARMEGQRTHSPLQAFNLATPKAPSI